uniref:INCENP_ARK-bind domain-containing protein n=1 Tax=Caenorhabditis tropicalis TaxID=1561998 RepID=A0A1I7TTW1_9PELO
MTWGVSMIPSNELFQQANQKENQNPDNPSPHTVLYSNIPQNNQNFGLYQPQSQNQEVNIRKNMFAKPVDPQKIGSYHPYSQSENDGQTSVRMRIFARPVNPPQNNENMNHNQCQNDDKAAEFRKNIFAKPENMNLGVYQQNDNPEKAMRKNIFVRPVNNDNMSNGCQNPVKKIKIRRNILRQPVKSECFTVSKEIGPVSPSYCTAKKFEERMGIYNPPAPFSLIQQELPDDDIVFNDMFMGITDKREMFDVPYPEDDEEEEKAPIYESSEVSYKDMESVLNVNDHYLLDSIWEPPPPPAPEPSDEAEMEQERRLREEWKIEEKKKLRNAQRRKNRKIKREQEEAQKQKERIQREEEREILVRMRDPADIQTTVPVKPLSSNNQEKPKPKGKRRGVKPEKPEKKETLNASNIQAFLDNFAPGKMVAEDIKADKLAKREFRDRQPSYSDQGYSGMWNGQEY